MEWSIKSCLFNFWSCILFLYSDWHSCYRGCAGSRAHCVTYTGRLHTSLHKRMKEYYNSMPFSYVLNSTVGNILLYLLSHLHQHLQPLQPLLPQHLYTLGSEVDATIAGNGYGWRLEKYVIGVCVSSQTPHCEDSSTYKALFLSFQLCIYVLCHASGDTFCGTSLCR